MLKSIQEFCTFFFKAIVNIIDKSKLAMWKKVRGVISETMSSNEAKYFNNQFNENSEWVLDDFLKKSSNISFSRP